MKEISFEKNTCLIKIGDFAFNCCSLPSQIKMPDSFIAIGSFFPQNCTSLEKIELEGHSKLTIISKYIAEGCNLLKSINILLSITSIGNNSFSRCSSLNNITIPSFMTSISEKAFSQCTELEEVLIDPSSSSLISICREAFSNCKFSHFVFPSSLTSIGNFRLL